MTTLLPSGTWNPEKRHLNETNAADYSATNTNQVNLRVPLLPPGVPGSFYFLNCPPTPTVSTSLC